MVEVGVPFEELTDVSHLMKEGLQVGADRDCDSVGDACHLGAVLRAVPRGHALHGDVQLGRELGEREGCEVRVPPKKDQRVGVGTLNVCLGDVLGEVDVLHRGRTERLPVDALPEICDDHHRAREAEDRDEEEDSDERSAHADLSCASRSADAASMALRRMSPVARRRLGPFSWMLIQRGCLDSSIRNCSSSSVYNSSTMAVSAPISLFRRLSAAAMKRCSCARSSGASSETSACAALVSCEGTSIART